MCTATPTSWSIAWKAGKRNCRACCNVCPQPSRSAPLFCSVFAKYADGRALNEGLQPIEALALEWLREHPEYASEFADADAAVARVYQDGINPFCTCLCTCRFLSSAA